MPFELIFKGYWNDELRFEERRRFSNMDDLNRYAALRINFLGYKNSCNRYDIRVNVLFDEDFLATA